MEMENGNGHGKGKRTRKAETDIESGKSFTRNVRVFKRSSTSTKDKEQMSCITGLEVLKIK